jgi:Holliday junction resolvase-like predicted endonuclease
MKTLRALTTTLLCILLPISPVLSQVPAQDVEVIVVPGGVPVLRWHGHAGRTYFIQGSDPNAHLENWTWSPYIEYGNGEPISHECGATADKAFFRLHYTDSQPPPGVTLEDWDADGDGLPNALELQLQTNPLNPDTSGDGIPDGWAHAHGLNPAAHNADGLFQGGPATNLVAYQQGVQSHPNATIADHDGDGVDNEADADPLDPDVDWKPARVGGYALIEIDVPEEAGYVRDFNDAGHVLFDGGIWNAGEWTALDQVVIDGDFYLDPYDFTYSSTGNSGWKLSPTGDILEWGHYNVYGPGDSEDIKYILRREMQNVNPAYQSAVSTLHTLYWYGLLGYSFLSLQALGEDSQGRIFAFKRFEPALPEESVPEIWMLDSNLVQTGYRQIPSGYYVHLHGNQVTPSGWLAVDANPHTGSTPAARTIVWNPSGQEITTTGGLPWYFTGLIELPHGKPALACRHHGANGLVYLLNENGDAFKTGEKLGGKNIHTFAGDGTAMTSDGMMWINGKVIPLRDLCPAYGDLKDAGWSFQIHKSNKHGSYLIQAHNAEQTVIKPLLLMPLDFSIFPPEPTDEDLQAAGDDNWEVGTFQIPADDPEFWVQANVMVPGIDENGNSAMMPAADGTEITWEIDTDSSDAGASLSSAATETENGHAAVLLTTSTVPGSRFKVRGTLTKLIMPGEASPPIAHEDSDGLAEVITQYFEVVPGNTASILKSSSVQSVPADETSGTLITAVFTDAAGNPVARGTDVNWRVSGGGVIRVRDHLIADENGTASATLVSGSVVGTQTITVEADGVVADIQIENTPVQIVSLSPAVSTLDIATGGTTTVTLHTSGVADGAPITWKSTRGIILSYGSVIENNTAQAVLAVDQGTAGIANVFATVGDAVGKCEVAFTSSAVATIEVSQPIIVYDASTDGSEPVPSLSGTPLNTPYFAESAVTIRAPAHPGAWATVTFSGSSAMEAFRLGFDSIDGGASPSSIPTHPAILSGNAEMEEEIHLTRAGPGALHLPDTTSAATINHHDALALSHGSIMDFSIRPEETDGQVLSKLGEYTAAFLLDGRLQFTLGSGPQATSVASTDPLTAGSWNDVRISIYSGHLVMRVNGSNSSTPLPDSWTNSTVDLTIGGMTGHFDELRITHIQQGLQGISIHATDLNAQGQVQLDANGEATITVSAQELGDGPPADSIGQNIDIEATVAGQTAAAKDAITVTCKGTAVLIRAIAGQTAIIGTDTNNLNRAEMAHEFLRRGVRDADRAGALPQDLSGDAAERGECGYLIAIWMEESVDEAGEIHPLMHVTAQNLPEEVGEVLNWMLAEMMVSAGHRPDSESFKDFILRNHKELLTALQALSAGNIGEFLTIAQVLDGDESFAQGSAVAEQVGAGVLQTLAKNTLGSAGQAYDNLGAFIKRQNWGVTLRERGDAIEIARRLQRSVINTVVGNADNVREVILFCSEFLLAQNIIEPEEAAALGFAYGVVEAVDQLGQDIAQPELLAQAAMQLLDLSISAVGGDEQAREALKEIGSMAAMMPISAVEQTEQEWEQGNYFQAGANAVVVVEVALVAKFVKDLAVKTTNKALLWGRHRTTDWQASTAVIGRRAEVLAFQRLESKGFKDIVPIQNSSGHGIDWVCRDRKGGVVFIEVKGHRLDAAPRLSRTQQDMKAFTETRLNQAISQAGHWKNVSPETLRNAQKILNAIEEFPIKGYVLNVDYAVSKLPRVRYYDWLNGVGNLANPKP